MKNRTTSRELNCEEVRTLLDDFWRGNLDRDVERRGRVRGHLLACQPCALAFGEALASANSSHDPAIPVRVPNRNDLEQRMADYLLGADGVNHAAIETG